LRVAAKEGSSRLASMAIMATTTSNSTRVNAAFGCGDRHGQKAMDRRKRI
jgi:hypothetical protein